MKKFTALLLIFTLLFLGTPLWAMDEPIRQDPNAVSIAGLKREYVLLALWNNATGGDNRTGQFSFFVSNTKDRPTEQMATEYLADSFGGYFNMRKVAPPRGDTYYCKSFNDNHGKGRAQQIIQALRNRTHAGPINLEDVFKIYIPTPIELGRKEEAQVQALRKAGDFEKANSIHNEALRKTEDEQMKKLMAEGNFAAAYAIQNTRTRQEDAEVGGMLISAFAEGTAKEKAEAQDLNRSMALRLAQSSADAPDDLAVEKIMAKGFQRMFGLVQAPKGAPPAP